MYTDNLFTQIIITGIIELFHKSQLVCTRILMTEQIYHWRSSIKISLAFSSVFWALKMLFFFPDHNLRAGMNCSKAKIKARRC